MDKASSSYDKTGSRFVKGRKQEALAEIEGWVGGSREEIIKAGAAKVSSQPSKNITEQKMLDSKLYDMSKQRFNCIVQCQWERKIFLEKQKRKTAVMRDLLRNVDLSALSENPFVTRRAATRPPERTQMLQRDLQQTAATTIPRQRNRQNSSLSVRDDNTFVTQRPSFPLQIKEKKTDESLLMPSEDSVSSEVVTSHRSQMAVSQAESQFGKSNRMWPLCDKRYTRLSEVLSDTYPKRIELRSKSSRISNQMLAVTTGYQ